jgi:hypothetical protein
MDSDISPIFNQVDDTTTLDSTPIGDVMRDDQPMMQQPQEQEYYPQHQQQYYQDPPAAVPASPHWDPFSSIGVTSWVVMAIVFVIGFIVGKLR